jgi:hypothetical protein
MEEMLLLATTEEGAEVVEPILRELIRPTQ